MNKKKLTELLLIFVISGVIGFIYETLFYRIDLGYFVKRGSTFGPWIPIYAFGGLLITLLTSKLAKKPFLVFLLSMLISGLLELATGFVFFKVFHFRLWNYSEEIWNFGNIGGYVCLRSVLLFGFAGLLLIYVIAPFVERLVSKDKKSILFIVSIILSIVFMLDTLIFWLI